MSQKNRSHFRRSALLLVVLACSSIDVTLVAAEADSLAGLERIEISPAGWKLTGRQSVQLVVTGVFQGGARRDLTAVAKYHLDRDAVRIQGTRVLPAKQGTAIITAFVAGKSAKSELVVQDMHEATLFSRDVLPTLSRHGCSSGACHGSPSGKGGFRLSLRAFMPTLDAETLLREELGRRVNALEPAKSLLLLKPTMGVAHGGGLKMRPSDTGYVAVRDWIGSGCQVDRTTSPCMKIEVWPSELRTLAKPYDRQQIRVVGHFEDGTKRDVTDLAVFSTSDESIASVTSSGLVQAQRRGEAAIVVRYLQHIRSVMVQSSERRPNFVWVDRPQHNYIDQIVDQKLRRLKLTPQAVCSDEQFIRRVFLDVLGILPSGDEVARFLDDPHPAKRERLIDRLLEHPQLARFWTLKWGDLLRMSRRQIGAKGLPQY